MIPICFHIFFFFFSSRRRHTRCSRDWSSDVCSSDLIGTDVVGGPYDPARLEIESLEPAVNAELAARRADDDPTLHDEGRDRRGLALREIRDLGDRKSVV